MLLGWWLDLFLIAKDYILSLSIVSDPFFYVVAVPAVLLLGISKSGFGAGFGSMAVPLMALAISVPQAAAILMPVLFVIDILGLHVFRKDFDKPLFKFLLPFGLLGVSIGLVLFKLMDAHTVSGIVGFFTLLFLTQRLIFPPSVDSIPPAKWLGALLTVTSGFTSFIAHAGGAPILAYLLPMRLSPLKFAATLSFFFFFINFAKWIPYGYLGLLDMKNMLTSLVLMPCIPIGVRIGLMWAKRIDPRLFYRLIHIGMFLTGTKLLWDGLH